MQYETVHMMQYYRTCNKKIYHISTTHQPNKFELGRRGFLSIYPKPIAVIHHQACQVH